MAATVKEYESYLGTPATVKRGDSHSELARAYLLESTTLTPKEADEIVKRTALAGSSSLAIRYSTSTATACCSRR
jgi:hypothetical protein